MASVPASIRNQLSVTMDGKERHISVTASAETGEEAFQSASQWIVSYAEQLEDDIQTQFSVQKEEATQKVDTLLPDFTAVKETLAEYDLENPLGVREARLTALEKELTANETQLSRQLGSEIGGDPTVRAYLQAVLSDAKASVGGGGRRCPRRCQPAGFGSRARQRVRRQCFFQPHIQRTFPAPGSGSTIDSGAGIGSERKPSTPANMVSDTSGRGEGYRSGRTVE